MNTETVRAAYRDGSLTPVDVLEQTLTRIDEVNDSINAIVFRDDVNALAQAEVSAARWKAGTPLSVLDGVPVSVKDSVRAAGMPWRHGTLPNRGLDADTVDSPLRRGSAKPVQSSSANAPCRTSGCSGQA